MGLHRKPLSYLILKLMKSLIYVFGIITLLATFSSCTAEKLETKNNSANASGNISEIDPPVFPPKR